jgi:ergothioneine biosynthesis protein EgtB
MNLITTLSGLEKKTTDINDIREDLINRYKTVRSFTEKLCANLAIEDYVIQSMPDVSPTKWHLAHTSWFFETFILRDAVEDYRPFTSIYSYLFNSYYIKAGERFTRAKRGLLSRPTVEETFKYRKHIDNSMLKFLENCSDKELMKFNFLCELGLNHEQQHQELIVTDIKHVFSINPLHPKYTADDPPFAEEVTPPADWLQFYGGIYEIGHEGNSFAFDNETPRHKTYVEPFEISSELVSNHEYLNFMESGGYERPELWLSDGWTVVENEKWFAPLYWEKIDGEWWNYKLSGFQKINLAEPACHVSYYEADAFARWKNCRLPSEEEWEIASMEININGNFAESEIFHPVPSSSTNNNSKIHQMFGDVWEWTSSAYSPYPGYKTLPGALGEYNGKFMSNQMVLRGGSCATSFTQIRKTYRNFFPPSAKWQFMGIRLVKDVL